MNAPRTAFLPATRMEGATVSTPEDVDVWIRLDVGKERRFREDGESLFAGSVTNDQANFIAVINEPRARRCGVAGLVIDQPGRIAQLPIAVANRHHPRHTRNIEPYRAPATPPATRPPRSLPEPLDNNWDTPVPDNAGRLLDTLRTILPGSDFPTLENSKVRSGTFCDGHHQLVSAGSKLLQSLNR